MLRRTGLTILAAAVLVDMIGFGIVLPLLPFYAESLGATPFEVTLIIASFSAAQLLTAPLWGRFSDRRGRRPLIIAGLFASAASYLIFALADSIPLLLASRLAAGAAGGTISVAQAYVADSTQGSERARGLGLIGAASGLGIMLGPAIGGYFSRFGLGAPGYVAAALCLVNAVAAIWLLPESPHFSGRSGDEPDRQPGFSEWAGALTRRPLADLLGVYFLSIMAFAAMTAVLALYLERVFGMDASQMGLVFTLAGAVTVVVRGVAVGHVVRWLGETVTIRVGCVLLGLSVGAIPLLPGPWWLGAIIPIWALATGILFPSLHSLISRSTDADKQGSILGGSQLAGGMGRILGPLWSGMVFEASIRTPFWIAAVVTAVGLMWSFRVPRSIGEPGTRWRTPLSRSEPSDLEV